MTSLPPVLKEKLYLNKKNERVIHHTVKELGLTTFPALRAISTSYAIFPNLNCIPCDYVYIDFTKINKFFKTSAYSLKLDNMVNNFIHLCLFHTNCTHCYRSETEYQQVRCEPYIILHRSSFWTTTLLTTLCVLLLSLPESMPLSLGGVNVFLTMFSAAGVSCSIRASDIILPFWIVKRLPELSVNQMFYAAKAYLHKTFFCKKGSFLGERQFSEAKKEITCRAITVISHVSSILTFEIFVWFRWLLKDIKCGPQIKIKKSLWPSSQWPTPHVELGACSMLLARVIEKRAYLLRYLLSVCHSCRR